MLTISRNACQYYHYSSFSLINCHVIHLSSAHMSCGTPVIRSHVLWHRHLHGSQHFVAPHSGIQTLLSDTFARFRFNYFARPCRCHRHRHADDNIRTFISGAVNPVRKVWLWSLMVSSVPHAACVAALLSASQAQQQQGAILGSGIVPVLYVVAASSLLVLVG